MTVAVDPELPHVTVSFMQGTFSDHDNGWKSGAGDGKRKYRSDTHNPLKSGDYEIGEALRVIIV